MNIEEIKKEINDIAQDGVKLMKALQPSHNKNNGAEDLVYFLTHYEMWYTKALTVVKQFTPDRLNDFILLYRNDKRKELQFSTYTISDALRTTTHTSKHYSPTTAYLCMARQQQMVQACSDSLDSKIRAIQVILQADVFDSEIESAKHLCKMGFLRAAGAICGVIIEKHLAKVCADRGITLKKKNPSIAEYNDGLKDNAYDTIEWRKIQRLGDIRNLCDHSKDREPTKDEVEELISGTERVIKTIF